MTKCSETSIHCEENCAPKLVWRAFMLNYYAIAEIEELVLACEEVLLEIPYASISCMSVLMTEMFSVDDVPSVLFALW